MKSDNVYYTINDNNIDEIYSFLDKWLVKDYMSADIKDSIFGENSIFITARNTNTNDIIGTISMFSYDSIRGIQNHINAASTPLEHTLLKEEYDQLGWLQFGYVHPERQNKGISTEMLQIIRDKFIKNRNITHIFCEAWLYDEQKDARKPLEEYGFTKVFTIPSNEYWVSQRVNNKTKCKICDGKCTCSGAVYRLNIKSINLDVLF